MRLGHYDRDEAMWTWDISRAMTLGANLPMPMYGEPQGEGNATPGPDTSGEQ